MFFCRTLFSIPCDRLWNRCRLVLRYQGNFVASGIASKNCGHPPGLINCSRVAFDCKSSSLYYILRCLLVVGRRTCTLQANKYLFPLPSTYPLSPHGCLSNSPIYLHVFKIRVWKDSQFAPLRHHCNYNFTFGLQQNRVSHLLERNIHRKTNKSTHQLVPGELYCSKFKDIEYSTCWLAFMWMFDWHRLTLSSTKFRQIYTSVVFVPRCEKDV